MKRMKLLMITLFFVCSLISTVVATDNVVVSELGINPAYLGDNIDSGKEYIELYNPTDSTIDVGNWFVYFKGRPSSPKT